MPNSFYLERIKASPGGNQASNVKQCAVGQSHARDFSARKRRAAATVISSGDLFRGRSKGSPKGLRSGVPVDLTT